MSAPLVTPAGFSTDVVEPQVNIEIADLDGSPFTGDPGVLHRAIHPIVRAVLGQLGTDTGPGCRGACTGVGERLRGDGNEVVTHRSLDGQAGAAEARLGVARLRATRHRRICRSGRCRRGLRRRSCNHTERDQGAQQRNDIPQSLHCFLHSSSADLPQPRSNTAKDHRIIPYMAT